MADDADTAVPPPNAHKVAFGEQIRRARKLRGWTQEELAKQVGTSQSVIDRIEHGRWTRLSIAVREAARVLGVSLPPGVIIPMPVLGTEVSRLVRIEARLTRIEIELGIFDPPLGGNDEQN